MTHGTCNGQHNAFNYAVKSKACYVMETVGGRYYYACYECALRGAKLHNGEIKEMEG